MGISRAGSTTEIIRPINDFAAPAENLTVGNRHTWDFWESRGGADTRIFSAIVSILFVLFCLFMVFVMPFSLPLRLLWVWNLAVLSRLAFQQICAIKYPDLRVDGNGVRRRRGWGEVMLPWEQVAECDIITHRDVGGDVVSYSWIFKDARNEVFTKFSANCGSRPITQTLPPQKCDDLTALIRMGMKRGLSLK